MAGPNEIVVAVATKEPTEGFPAYIKCDTTVAAHGIIADVFEKFGNSVGVAVLVDGKPVRWEKGENDVEILGPID